MPFFTIQSRYLYIKIDQNIIGRHVKRFGILHLNVLLTKRIMQVIRREQA